MGRSATPARATFLKDVLICSLGAYGGPESHMGVYLNQLVAKRGYLTEEELIELIALCSLLPGPTSTQTIVSIGYKIGGPVLALLTMLVWALPVLIMMTALSFAYGFLEKRGLSGKVLKFIGPMAVGFILFAAIRIGKKVVHDIPTAALFVFGVVTTFFIRSPWIFPAVLVVGGIVTIAIDREEGMWNKVKVHPPWRYLVAFAIFALGGILLASVTDNRLAQLFESFYRYGYLVFGGGQVVVPVMHSELVDVRHFITNEEFLAGYGLVQGLPGPLFSFAAYVGGMASGDSGPTLQVLGAVISGIGIFLPGLLLIYFVYPLWEDLKQIRAIKISIRGISAVAGGLIAVSAVIIMRAAGITVVNVAIVVFTASLLYFTKIPAPLLVAAALVAGIVI